MEEMSKKMLLRNERDSATLDRADPIEIESVANSLGYRALLRSSLHRPHSKMSKENHSPEQTNLRRTMESRASVNYGERQEEEDKVLRESV